MRWTESLPRVTTAAVQVACMLKIAIAQPVCALGTVLLVGWRWWRLQGPSCTWAAKRAGEADRLHTGGVGGGMGVVCWPTRWGMW